MRPPPKANRRSGPITSELARAVDPLHQPARCQLTLTHRREHFREDLSGQRPAHVRRNSRREFGEQRMCLRCFLRELDFDHVFESNSEPAGQPFDFARLKTCVLTPTNR